MTLNTLVKIAHHVVKELSVMVKGIVAVIVI